MTDLTGGQIVGGAVAMIGAGGVLTLVGRAGDPHRPLPAPEPERPPVRLTDRGLRLARWAAWAGAWVFLAGLVAAAAVVLGAAIALVGLLYPGPFATAAVVMILAAVLGLAAVVVFRL